MTVHDFMDAKADSEREVLVIGLLTSVGETLDAFFVEIAQRWRDQGAIVEVAAGTAADSFLSPGVVASLTREPSPKNWRALHELRSWVRKKRVSVVVTNTAAASALVRTAGVGVPVVYFCHGLHWNDRRLADLPFRIVERLLLSRTDGIVCINSHDEEWFFRKAPRIPRLRLINGVGLDTNRFVRRSALTWDEASEPLRLVWCGEYSSRKNPVAAVQLVHLLHRRGINVTIDMLGEGPLQDSEGVKSSIAGVVNSRGVTDVVPYFEKAHVLVQTSRWEGLPRVGLEALAIGLPVAGFDVKGVRDLPGVQVSPVDDLEALAESVLTSARRDAGGDIPDPAMLSYVYAADSLLEFVESVRSGSFPHGPTYSR